MVHITSTGIKNLNWFTRLGDFCVTSKDFNKNKLQHHQGQTPSTLHLLHITLSGGITVVLAESCFYLNQTSIQRKVTKPFKSGLVAAALVVAASQMIWKDLTTI